LDEGGELTLLDPLDSDAPGLDARSIPIHALWPNLVRTSTTPPGGITGKLHYVGQGEWKDFNDLDPAGAVVMMDFNSGVNWQRAAILGALLAAGAAALAAGGGAQDDEHRVAVQSMGVAENLYLVSGGGGHTALLITQNHGVVLVDTKNPGWGPSILTTVQALTDQPVTTIINTHAHGDHVGSNPHFADAVRFVAHENARESMADAELFAGGNERFLPNETYRETLTLFEGLDQIDLYHFGPAHTNGDTIVVFPALATAHVGDLFPRKAAPFIDRANGGSGVAYPETLAKAVAGIPGVDTVIPGHIPMTSWSDFVR